MRPYWKGYLKLALVSCPIALHAACSTAERIAFRQVNKATGNRLRQQLIDEETRAPVALEDRGRGAVVWVRAAITCGRFPSPTSRWIPPLCAMESRLHEWTRQQARALRHL